MSARRARRSVSFAGAGAAAAALAGLAACAEPAIEMRLELPPADQAGRYDVSCVGAVEVFIRGVDRGRPPGDAGDPGRPADDAFDCIEITGADSFAEIRRAIAGRFELALPASGLAGVDVRASTGTCNKDNAPGDTIFYAAAEYRGGDELALRMTPNLSCNAKQLVPVRPVDLLALTRAEACPPLLPDNVGGVDSATIHPTALSPAIFDRNNDIASMVGNVATLPLYTSTEDDSCIALGYGDQSGVTTAASCVRRGAGVCSSVGQIELPIINGNVAFQAADLDALDANFGWVVGGVWGHDAAGKKIRLAGATVRPARPADADRVRVTYADYPAAAAVPTTIVGATATNATGLFIAYVGRPTDFIVSAPGHVDEIVRMGSPGEPSTALVLLRRR